VTPRAWSTSTKTRPRPLATRSDENEAPLLAGGHVGRSLTHDHQLPSRLPHRQRHRLRRVSPPLSLWPGFAPTDRPAHPCHIQISRTAKGLRLQSLSDPARLEAAEPSHDDTELAASVRACRHWPTSFGCLLLSVFMVGTRLDIAACRTWPCPKRCNKPWT
jgi:hypothetical protein